MKECMDVRFEQIPVFSRLGIVMRIIQLLIVCLLLLK